MCLWLTSFCCCLQISPGPSFTTCHHLLPRTATAHCTPRVHILLVTLSSQYPASRTGPPLSHQAADSPTPPHAPTTSCSAHTASATRAYPGPAEPEGCICSRPQMHVLPGHPPKGPLRSQSSQTLYISNGSVTHQLHAGGEPVASSVSTATQSRGLQHSFHSS